MATTGEGLEPGSPEAARRLFAVRRRSRTRGSVSARDRGTTSLHGTGSLRIHARCCFRPVDHSPPETWPATIASVTDLSRYLTGAHRTWFGPRGFNEATFGKAPIDTPRRAMGGPLGHAVRFGAAGEVARPGKASTPCPLRCVLPTMPMIALSRRRLYIARDDILPVIGPWRP
jgi:hypothetical protein